VLDGHAHVVVDGLELRNIGYPILLSGGAHDNWLRNLYVHDGGSSILNNAVGNRLEGNRFDQIGSEAANAGDALFVHNGSSRNLILRNQFGLAGHSAITVVYTAAGEPTNDDNVIAYNVIANPWAFGVALSGPANRTLLECNTISRTADGSGANYARNGIDINGTNNVVRYNVVYATGAAGLTLAGRTYGGRVQNARGNHIYHNTFYGNGGASIEIAQKDVGVVQDNIIENNIFWQNAGFEYQGTRYAITVDQYHAASGNTWSATGTGGNIIRHNIFPTGQVLYLLIRQSGNVQYTLSQQSTLSGWTANQAVDPRLSAPPTDVTLLSGSPAIDAGRLIPGVPYTGAAPDLGARER
jgi:hypothetical protein